MLMTRLATHLRRAGRTAYTQTITDTVVTTYTYDTANRLLVTLSPGHLVTIDSGWRRLGTGCRAALVGGI